VDEVKSSKKYRKQVKNAVRLANAIRILRRVAWGIRHDRLSRLISSWRVEVYCTQRVLERASEELYKMGLMPVSIDEWHDAQAAQSFQFQNKIQGENRELKLKLSAFYLNHDKQQDERREAETLQKDLKDKLDALMSKSEAQWQARAAGGYRRGLRGLVRMFHSESQSRHRGLVRRWSESCCTQIQATVYEIEQRRVLDEIKSKTREIVEFELSSSKAKIKGLENEVIPATRHPIS